MSTKINIDVDQSLKEAPPELYYKQLDSKNKRLFPGTHFVKRIIINRGNISYKTSEQIRELDAGGDRVERLKPSFRIKGIIYNKMPPAVKVDPEDNKRFSGLSGFGRNKVFDELEYDTWVFDVLKFDNKLSEEIFKVNSNETDEFVPNTPNSKNTIIKSVVNAIANKVIGEEDSDILEFLNLICRNRTDWHKSILDTIRKEHISRWPTMKAWNTKSATEFAIANNLPYQGDKNKNVLGLGYVRKWSQIKSVFWDAMVTSTKYGMSKVKLWTWIDNPKPSTLAKERQNVRDDIKKLEEDFQLWIANYIDMDIQEVRKRGKNRFSLELAGFLPQDVEKLVENNGNPKEEGVVQ